MIFSNTTKKSISVISMFMVLLMGFATAFAPVSTYAAEDDGYGVGDKVKLVHDHQIRYGSGDGGYSNLMEAHGIDDSLGNRPVFCTQPNMPTPSAGTYTIDKMYTSDSGKSDVLRKLVYYAKGYPGWSWAKDKWFSSGSWSSDDIYGIFHIAVSYVEADYNDSIAAWGGGTVKGCMYSDNWAKMKEIVNDCKSDSVVPEVPAGFKVFYIKNGGYQNIIGGILENGYAKIKKTSANTDITNGNDCYSLGGAQFGLYKDGSKVATITTKADGTSNTVEVKAGTYTLKEDVCPKGYAKAADRTVTVKAGATTEVAISDMPQSDPISILLQKVDRETGKAVPLGAAILKDAEYLVSYYDGQYDTAKAAVDSGEPTRQWVLKTDEDGFCDLDEKYLVSGDKFYHASNGEVTLPLGTVLIRESKAPEGYLLSNEVYVRNITSDGTAEMVKTYKEPTTPEQVKRGDLDFVKVKDSSMARLAGVPFKITSKTTGESHIIVTDANGYANTSSGWNLHTNNTNRGQSNEDGIWFEMDKEGNKTTKVDNALGALPYDLYVLDEQPCEANKGCRLLEGIEIAITRDSVTVKLGTLTDDAIEIETTAKDSETGGHFAKADEKVTIVDTVKYTGLYKNKEYVMKGTLMDKETGKPLLDKEGKEITAEQKFTAKSEKGTVDMTFTFDASLMQGKTTVVFESAFYENLEVAVHADIEDEGQTIHFPDIKTTAKDKASGDHKAKVNKETVIVDEVQYTNLIPGKEYTVEGKLINKSTGFAVRNGLKAVTASKTFVPETADGTVSLEFKFDSTALGGKSTVVFESLKYEGKEIAVHADINDEGQTVTFEQPPAEHSPKTGDNLPMIPIVALIIASAAGISAALIRRKHKAGSDDSDE